MTGLCVDEKRGTRLSSGMVMPSNQHRLIGYKSISKRASKILVVVCDFSKI